MVIKRMNYLWMIPLGCMAITAIIYILIFIFRGSFPLVNKITLDIGEGEFWQYPLSFSVPRVWDIFFIGILSFFMVLTLINLRDYYTSTGYHHRPVENFLLGMFALLALSTCSSLIEGIATFFTFFSVFTFLGIIIVFFVAMDIYNRWEYNFLLSLVMGCMGGLLLGFKTGFLIGCFISIFIFIAYLLASTLGLLIRNIALIIHSGVFVKRTKKKCSY